MSELWLVFHREFTERVRTKAFLLGTFLFPIFLAALFILPTMLGGSETRTLVVVDEAPSAVGERFVALLTAPSEESRANTYLVDRSAGPLADVQADLNARVESKEIDGFVVLPADVVERSEIRYRASTIASPGMLRDLRAAASEAVQAERLQQAGLDGGAVAALVRRVEVDNARITGEGEERGDAVSTFLFAYILAFVIYFVVTIYGVGVLRSVLEEKTNRISEVLVSSMRSGHLMAGKILGVGAAALLQVLIWGVVATLLTQSEALTTRAGLPPGALQALSLDAGTAAAFLGFFVLGFLVFAAMFAALGAAVTSEQEAQSFQMILILPLIVPLLFLVPLTSEPLGPIATALGLFPLTSPIAMPMRMASAAVPLWQTLAALGLLALALAAVAWLAGRVYRIGILSTGKRPTLRELGRWLRMA